MIYFLKTSLTPINSLSALISEALNFSGSFFLLKNVALDIFALKQNLDIFKSLAK